MGIELTNDPEVGVIFSLAKGDIALSWRRWPETAQSMAALPNKPNWGSKAGYGRSCGRFSVGKTGLRPPLQSRRGGS